MKRLILITLLLSIPINIYLLLDKYIFSVPDPTPIWHPFDINFDMTYDALIADGYKRIPEDVPILGKTIDSVTIYYQLSYHDYDPSFDYKNPKRYIYEYDTVFKEPDYDKYIVYWRNLVIELSDFKWQNLNRYIYDNGGYAIPDENFDEEKGGHFKIYCNCNQIYFDGTIFKKRETGKWIFEMPYLIPNFDRKIIEENKIMYNNYELEK